MTIRISNLQILHILGALLHKDDMRRNLLIIIGVIAIAVTLVAIFAFKGEFSGSPPPSGGSAQTATPPHIVSTMPADAPKGNTFTIQGNQGVVTLNNFYRTAVGYWPEMDAIEIESNVNYTIWYYRSTGSFEIALSATGTSNDEKNAEAKLMSDLRVDEKTFCGLSVSASFLPGGGATYKQDLPINACMNAF